MLFRSTINPPSTGTGSTATVEWDFKSAATSATAELEAQLGNNLNKTPVKWTITGSGASFVGTGVSDGGKTCNGTASEKARITVSSGTSFTIKVEAGSGSSKLEKTITVNIVNFGTNINALPNPNS